jgi:hypothetical protein
MVWAFVFHLKRKYIYKYIYAYTYIFFQTKNGCPDDFYRLLFAHRANGSLSFVRLLTKKQTKVISLQMD